MISWWTSGELSEAGSLQWLSSSLTIGIAIAGALVALAAAWWTGRRAPSAQRWKRVVELVLWALALSIMVVCLARPSWVVDSDREQTGRLVILVDSSRSMSLEERSGQRSDAVDDIVEMLQEEHGSGPVEIYHFDEELRLGLPEDYEGSTTDLGVALASVHDRFLGQELRGVVVLTDGLDRGSLRRDVSAARTAGELSTRLAPSLPGPLTIYQVGTDSGLMDVSIQDVITGGYAFQRTPFTLRVVVAGPPGYTVPVTLEREGRLVQTQTTTLDDEGKAEVVFEHKSSRAGRFAYEFSIPEDREDAVKSNNRYPFVVHVVREKMRVLQVSGSPSYDQKFLRLFLQEDPSVDLVSFFILRTNEDLDAGWTSRELSLIEFPYERLFSEELRSFDLVVLQNFDYKPYFAWQADELLGNIARAVEDGDIALVMTGGDRSFDLGHYSGTPIERVLPVRLGLANQKTDLGKFRPVLTSAGEGHPITRLAATGDASAEVWGRLPEMDGLNLTAGAHPDAAVLLEHPTLRGAGGQPVPVAAVREVGQGRTMALTVDASWRWSFSEAAVGRGNQAYLRFWKNSMRWLLGDPTDRRVMVAPSRENVLLGEPVRLVARIRDPSYQPQGDHPVAMVIMQPDGQKHEVDLVTDAAGEAVYEFTPSIRGSHRVEIAAGSASTEQASTVFAATDRDPELAEIRPDTTFLRQLVELYGESGAWRPRGDLEPALVNEAALQTIAERQQQSLASMPLAVLLFGLFSSLAWWVRRRSGGL